MGILPGCMLGNGGRPGPYTPPGPISLDYCFANIPLSEGNSRSITAQNIYGQSPVNFNDAVEIVLPEDPDIAINIQDFGASGDGRKDDTDAIQSAIYEAARKNKALYFPNGVYRVTREIRFEQPNGRALFIAPHMYGQSIDGVVLRLDDRAVGFSDADQPDQAVLRTVHADDGTTWKDISADFFNRFIVNLTIDTGDNPGAVGIKFHSNNTGILQNVRIIGNGAIGLDVSSVDLNGPHLIQNLEIEGFAIGVKASGANSTTLSNLAIRDASTYGLHHSTGVLQVEGLTVENAPIAVYSRPAQNSNKTTLTLINGHLEGESSQPAIISGGVLFARNISTSGYKQALKSFAGKTLNMTTENITEYSSHGVDRAFTDNINASANLPIRYLPTQYDPNSDNWLSVKDFGANPNDKVDDTQTIQAAVDIAAQLGKTTLYFPGGTPPEPNWYIMDGEVTLHGSLQHIIGFAPARILGKGQFTIKDDPAAPDFIQFQGFNFTKIGYENASSRTVLMQNLTGRITASGPGGIYLNSIATGQLSIDHPEAKIWARQLNTEKPANSPENISNDGGFLWILGHKTEQGGIKARTFNGGYTEVLGAYIYAVGRFGKFETIYEVVDAHATFAGIRERTGNHRFRYFFKETRADESHLYDSLPAGNRSNRAASLYSASQKTFCPSNE